ncbi:MAG: hypothetical protein QJT80_11575 [Candidatus Thiocaldithrix dubininis]|uniref:Type I restriction modification DNA specificity domain-containing protein n=1 Tax=Candidatus Thiocaldithrix dubininis TaxID=3080823 RepID=A0AA95H5X3_9GAMM|nr:MAG: hypothetical protein QJT80_11575 [Candidatus Thiocaldithrix dubininis]
MEGLEATEIKLSKVNSGTFTKRIDPEYFNKTAILAQKKLESSPTLGSLVKDGYRVVYETTEAIEQSQGILNDYPFFLQSADINTPFINKESMICVHQNDWERYPKGRIQHGEILIEVKGKAEKIAFVPDDFPEKTLVTGTCFKLNTKNPKHRFLLIPYLTSKYGQALKNRLKTNLLVSYIAKDDLYSLPVPHLSENMLSALEEIFDNIFKLQRQSVIQQQQAEQILLKTLSLENWQPTPALSYERKSSEVFAAGRLDAEYFHPEKASAVYLLNQLECGKVKDMFESVRELWQPETAIKTQVVQNYDLTDALSPFLDADKELVYPESISSTKKVLSEGQIIVSRLRSYLKEIALVLHDCHVPMVASTEFIVLKPIGKMNVATLMVYLRSILPQIIFKWSQDGSNHPRFDEKELLNLQVPNILLEHQQEISEVIHQSIIYTKKSKLLLEAAKRAVEIAIEDSEAAALAYLQPFLQDETL